MTDNWTDSIFTGSWRPGGAGLAEVSNPATGRTIASIGLADVTDLDSSVSAAAAAQREWAALTYDARAAVMRRAARILQDDPDRLVSWLVSEAGSAQGKAGFETGLVVSELDESAALASAPYGELLRSNKPRLSISRRVPLGVVGVIAPFNFPAILAMRSVAPALALGNAVVLKPDPRTSVSGGLLLAEVLAEAGLPEGVLHVLPGGADVGAAMVAHPDVACLSFTGSTAAGRKIAEAAGPLLKRVHLELGGNNALLVLPDADVDAAASAGAWGSFLHQGQICMTAGRHLVHSSIAEEYAHKLAEKASALPVGDPADPGTALGPLIDAGQRDRVAQIVDSAVGEGASLLTGGPGEDLYFRPTVLSAVATGMTAWREEIFGPVDPILAYDSDDEAIDVINASEYGLSVGILTTDAYRGLELSNRIVSGIVHINDQTVDDEAVIPFGGTKASGVGGNFGGTRANLETFTDQQWVTVQSSIERYPF